MPFHGFNDPALETVDGSDLFGVSLYLAEVGELLELLSKRLGGKVLSSRRVDGRDQRTGRDYFFDNLEIRRRSDPGSPCFIGVYHYREPAARKGSHLEAWRAAHDDEPAWSRPLPEIVADARASFAESRSQQWCDALAEEMRAAIGL